MRKQRGFTLIEMVVFIVVLGVGITGTLAAIVHATRDAADPLIQLRAAELGKSYLDEVMAVPYAKKGEPCDNPDVRADFEHLECYNGLSDQPPQPATGDEETMDEVYRGWTVEVAVDNEDKWEGADGRRVIVTVTPPGNGAGPIELSAFRGKEN
ncbi:MSHA pilin protein MshD [Thiohalospira halophila DSM 15071]|uniref:MSHA pilin protein MshD n=1 Tax=Thiohalospira halophila DSM 15071 TaxID=1123397 RepID=A0A1I1N7R9_9GAMM|nr:type II secretion system protein [Thiohalospira halophila]SFC93764.1 MSHA pilin protein MshD [Thiohalospira halophila DSM 15071]